MNSPYTIKIDDFIRSADGYINGNTIYIYCRVIDLIDRDSGKHHDIYENIITGRGEDNTNLDIICEVFKKGLDRKFPDQMDNVNEIATINTHAIHDIYKLEDINNYEKEKSKNLKNYMSFLRNNLPKKERRKTKLEEILKNDEKLCDMWKNTNRRSECG